MDTRLRFIAERLSKTILESYLNYKYKSNATVTNFKAAKQVYHLLLSIIGRNESKDKMVETLIREVLSSYDNVNINTINNMMFFHIVSQTQKVLNDAIDLTNDGTI